MEMLLQDLRYTLRTLGRQPGFVLTAILTLAVGIGATTAMFSIVNAIVLRPLPIERADRVMAVTNYYMKSARRGVNVSGQDFRDWRERNRSFEALASYAGWETSVRAGENADYATPVVTSEDFFRALAARAQLGRLLTADDYRAGSPLAAVITDGYWRRQFNANPSALGATVKFGEHTFIIIGVLAPGFRFPARADIYYPDWVWPDSASRSGNNYRAIGRLRDNVTVEQANADMRNIARDLEQQYPATNKAKSVEVVPLQALLVGDTGAMLYVLLGAVGFVLLIACANVANLLLARLSGRRREMTVRAAVGAGRVRLVRQLLTESAVLGITAGLAGLLMAKLSMTALVAIAPRDLPRLDEVAVDGAALAFTLAISFLSSLVFGTAPALQMSRAELMDGLRQSGKGTGAATTSSWTRNAFVVAEVALTVVLVVGAALLARSLVALASVNLGFSAEHLLVLNTTVPIAGRDDAPRATAFYRDLLTELRAMPGVSAVAGVTRVPTAGGPNGSYRIEGIGQQDFGTGLPQALFTVATPDYFRTMHIPLTLGRDFNNGDVRSAPFVAIVNESLVKLSFGGVNPIGHRIQCGLDSPEFMTIVGVVADVRTEGPSRPAQPELYMPFEQHPRPASALALVARTDAIDPLAMADTMRRKIQQRNPDVPVRAEAMTMTLETASAGPRFRTFLFGAFAVVALLLAVAGVYGVMAYMVSQRVSEIGLRVALGASPGSVLRLVMTHGARLTLLGLALGVGLALVASRFLSGFLFGVQPHDPIVLIAVVTVVAVAATLASYIPSRRALRVDPMVALRAD
jgi:putative ABC transport system permease protein